MLINNFIFLIIILSFALVLGVLIRHKSGKIIPTDTVKIMKFEYGVALGSRGTVLLFTTSFCSSCRATKALVKDVVKDEVDISYYEVDAESNLELVRKVDVRSTPTTLFLDSYGFEIARATGTPKRDQLIKVVESL